MTKPKSNRAGQNLAKVVHDEARSILLRHVSGVTKQLDELYDADAEKIKATLHRALRLSGFSAQRVGQLIDEVFAASRNARVGIVQKAVLNAIRDGQGLDKKTFDALFGDEKQLDPLQKGRPGLRLSGTPLPQQASGSEDESA